MSQTSPQRCPNCQAPVYPGQRACSNCGNIFTGPVAPTVAASSDAFGAPAPTVAASPYQNPPSNMTSPYSSGGSQPQLPFTQYSNNSGTPPPPPVYNGMSAPVPPPPTDPYRSASTSPSDPYGGFSTPNFAQPQAKKRSPWPFIIIGAIVVVLIACASSSAAIMNALNGAKSNTGTNPTSGLGNLPGSNNTGNNNTTTSNFPASQQISNLSIVYSSDQITFTSLQQADKFSDDTFTSFSTYNKSYYVRVNFKEQQQASRTSFFSYRSGFHLIMPDKSVIAPTETQELSGPDSGVVRTNWIDFETKKPVDLTQLSLRVGADDENQMVFPLKTGADVSKYQPKTVTLNKPFQYANMNWTLKDATQSLYFDGQQAKSGKVYVTVDLVVNNPTQNEYFLDNFIRLKSGDTVTATDYGSKLDDMDIIKAGTTNIQGSATFLTPPASSYTLDFLAGDQNSWPEQTVPLQIS